jgi:RAB6A-GEF complex partner protein 1
LRFHLSRSQVREAVTFASHYQSLVFFAHALEVLLHTVIESETDHTDPELPTSDDLLPVTVEFLDHFDAALEVVVGCARKTEMARWRRLFDIVGNPKALFEVGEDHVLTATLLLSQWSSDLSIGKFADDGRILPSCAP